MARNGWPARQANGGAIASGWPLDNDGGQRLAGGGPPWHHTGWPTMAGVRMAADLMAGHNYIRCKQHCLHKNRMSAIVQPSDAVLLLVEVFHLKLRELFSTSSVHSCQSRSPDFDGRGGGQVSGAS